MNIISIIQSHRAKFSGSSPKGRIFVHTVTIPEGWTMFDIAAELDRPRCLHARKLSRCRERHRPDLRPRAAGARTSRDISFLPRTNSRITPPANKPPNAWSRNFRAVWESLNPSGTANLPAGLTADQVVTLASLVERETPRKDERPLVAGVFYNRIKARRPLAV